MLTELQRVNKAFPTIRVSPNSTNWRSSVRQLVFLAPWSPHKHSVWQALPSLRNLLLPIIHVAKRMKEARSNGNLFCRLTCVHERSSLREVLTKPSLFTKNNWISAIFRSWVWLQHPPLSPKQRRKQQQKTNKQSRNKTQQSEKRYHAWNWQCHSGNLYLESKHSTFQTAENFYFRLGWLPKQCY